HTLITNSNRTTMLLYFFFSCYGHHRHLHSFPTRRSSDLVDRQRPHQLARPVRRLQPGRCLDRHGEQHPDGIDGHGRRGDGLARRSEEHTSELQSQSNLVCRLLLEKKKKKKKKTNKNNNL